MSAKVLVAKADYDDCSRAIAQAFEQFPLDLKGKRVAIKVNALKASMPEEALTTHHRFLSAVIKQVETMGPKRIAVGDNVGTESYGCTDYVFEKTRMKEAAGKYYVNFALETRRFNFPWVGSVAVSKEILDADVYISLPKLKTHGLTMLSGSIKNNFGFLPGAQKARMHVATRTPEEFGKALVEVFLLRPPDLAIVDAIVAMQGSGPASPDLRVLKTVCAASDCAALDTVMAKMIGFEVEDVPYLAEARRRQVGETYFDNIEILGDFAKAAGYSLPLEKPETTVSYASGVAGGRTSWEFFDGLIRLHPVVDHKLCNPDCTICVDACPSGAMTSEQEIKFNPDLCLGCCSCKENCPSKAIRLES